MNGSFVPRTWTSFKVKFFANNTNDWTYVSSILKQSAVITFPSVDGSKNSDETLKQQENKKKKTRKIQKLNEFQLFYRQLYNCHVTKFHLLNFLMAENFVRINQHSDQVRLTRIFSCIVILVDTRFESNSKPKI